MWLDAWRLFVIVFDFMRAAALRIHISTSRTYFYFWEFLRINGSLCVFTNSQQRNVLYIGWSCPIYYVFVFAFVWVWFIELMRKEWQMTTDASNNNRIIVFFCFFLSKIVTSMYSVVPCCCEIDGLRAHKTKCKQQAAGALVCFHYPKRNSKFWEKQIWPVIDQRRKSLNLDLFTYRRMVGHTRAAGTTFGSYSVKYIP